MRTPGNGGRMKSTIGVSTRDAVIGRATVGRTLKRAPQVVRVSFRGRLSWRPLSFQSPSASSIVGDYPLEARKQRVGISQAAAQTDHQLIARVSVAIGLRRSSRRSSV